MSVAPAVAEIVAEQFGKRTPTQLRDIIAERVGVTIEMADLDREVRRLRSLERRHAAGAKPTPRLPTPEDFADRSADMTNGELAQHYGVGRSTIARWRRTSGVPGRWTPPPQCLPKPIPDDFVANVRHMTGTELAAHYGASRATITRWRRETGVVGTVPMGPRGRNRGVRCNFRLPGSPAQIGHSARDMSIPGQAADYLRRYGPVFRCDAVGKPLPDGFFWNRGGHVLSDEDVIQRATRLGFDPDSWRKIAA